MLTKKDHSDGSIKPHCLFEETTVFNTRFCPPVFGEKINEPFCLQNLSNFKREFLFDNFD